MPLFIGNGGAHVWATSMLCLNCGGIGVRGRQRPHWLAVMAVRVHGRWRHLTELVLWEAGQWRWHAQVADKIQ